VRPRRLLAVGAILTILGVAIAGTAPILGTGSAERTYVQQTLGGVILLVGWAVLGWGIHRFGRSSED
jgi:uncharacterized membrane protein YidH (DUF202 family)